MECVPDSLEEREGQYMSQRVMALTKGIGSCERLVQTPIPFTYARHTSRFLTMYLWTLMPILVTHLNFFLVPTMALMTWALFGIQEIGLVIEDPFRETLRLEVICETLLNDVTSIANQGRKGQEKFQSLYI